MSSVDWIVRPHRQYSRISLASKACCGSGKQRPFLLLNQVSSYSYYWYFVADCQTANFLPAADHIICLSKEGNISEQGSFRSLKNAGGYVQSLLEDKPTHEVSENTGEEDVIEQTTQPKQTASKQHDEQEDSRRQRGDSTVYRYYFSSTGGLFMVALLGLEIVWAFLESFPSLSSPLIFIPRQR